MGRMKCRKACKLSQQTVKSVRTLRNLFVLSPLRQFTFSPMWDAAGFEGCHSIITAQRQMKGSLFSSSYSFTQIKNNCWGGYEAYFGCSLCETALALISRNVCCGGNRDYHTHCPAGGKNEAYQIVIIKSPALCVCLGGVCVWFGSSHLMWPHTWSLMSMKRKMQDQALFMPKSYPYMCIIIFSLFRSQFSREQISSFFITLWLIYPCIYIPVLGACFPTPTLCVNQRNKFPHH